MLGTFGQQGESGGSHVVAALETLDPGAAGRARHLAATLGLAAADEVMERLAEEWVAVKQVRREMGIFNTQGTQPPSLHEASGSEAQMTSENPDVLSTWDALPRIFASRLFGGCFLAPPQLTAVMTVCKSWRKGCIQNLRAIWPALDKYPGGCAATSMPCLESICVKSNSVGGYMGTAVDRFFTGLSALHSLTDLDVSRVRKGLSDSQLGQIRGAVRLERLRLSVKRPHPHSSVTATAAGLSELLAELPRLEHLAVECSLFRKGDDCGGTLTIEALGPGMPWHRAAPSHWPGLRMLILAGCSFPEGRHFDLQHASSLTGLQLQSRNFDPLVLDLPMTLESLEIIGHRPRGDTAISDTFLCGLRKLPNLWNLAVRNTALGDDSLRFLAAITSIKHLDVGLSSRVTTPGLGALFPISAGITALNLASVAGNLPRPADPDREAVGLRTDCSASAVLDTLGEFTGLQTLSLHGQSIESLKPIESLGSLTSLDVGQVPLKQQHLYSILAVTSLHHIGLQHSLASIGSSIPMVLRQLQCLPYLTSLDLSKNQRVLLQHLPILSKLSCLRRVELQDTAANFQLRALCNMTKDGFSIYPPLRRLDMLLAWQRAIPVLERCPHCRKSVLLSRALPAFLAALDPDGQLLSAFESEAQDL